MKAQHTAGPWRKESGVTFIAVHAGTSANVSTKTLCINTTPEINREICEADYSLIAASPDLLKCLEDIMQDLFGRLNHGVSMEHMQAAAAALAMAKGNHI